MYILILLVTLFLAYANGANDNFKGVADFLISVGLGAALTVFIAAKIGIPISTTHSLVGALVGAGLVSAWTQINFHMLAVNFLYPCL